MKPLQYVIIATLALCISGCNQSDQKRYASDSDPLSEWNEGPAKTSIINFINSVTDVSGKGFVAVADRVAVFDMDGTLLLEKPYPVNFDVVIRLLEQRSAGDPSLLQKQPFKAVHEQDWAYFDTLGYFGDDGIYDILLTATEGYTEDQYRDLVLEYFRTVRDKRFNKPYDQLVYVPMVQLIRYLQENQFEVYIVSGSDPEFTRTLSEKAMHIPVRNVLGSTVLTEWIETDSGSSLVRLHEYVQPINDEGGKAVNILNKIGKTPVIAVGNSPGDYPMLQYSKNSPFSLQMIVNHDDPAREYVYDSDTMSTLCRDYGWQLISMKKDFKTVFGRSATDSNK